MFGRKKTRGSANAAHVIEKARLVRQAFESGVPLEQALRDQDLGEDQYLDILAKTAGSGKLTPFKG
ncbi:MAG: hypothetical protein ACFE0P_02050 [Oceanicaulis sp.]